MESDLGSNTGLTLTGCVTLAKLPSVPVLSVFMKGNLSCIYLIGLLGGFNDMTHGKQVEQHRLDQYPPCARGCSYGTKRPHQAQERMGVSSACGRIMGRVGHFKS